jgi:hypothetical protein
MFEDYTEQEKLKLAGFVTSLIEDVLKDQGVPPNLVKFCKIIAGSESPVKDRFLMDLSLLKGFNWRKKDLVAFRQDLFEWQRKNGEFIAVEMKDKKSFSYKITENLQGLLLEELKKHFLKAGLKTEHK